MKLKVTGNYKISCMDTDILGFVGEKNARTIEVDQPTVEGADTYRLRFCYADGVVYDVPITDGKYTVEQSVLRAAGYVSVQWLATKSTDNGYTLVAKSDVITLRIDDSIGDSEPVPTPEQALDALDEIKASKTKAEKAASTAKDSADEAAKNAESMSEPIEMQKHIIKTSENPDNYFDKSNLFSDGYYDEKGNFIEKTNYVCSKTKIPVKEGETLYCYKDSGGTIIAFPGLYISIFDKGGNFLIGSVAQKSLTAVADSDYALVSFQSKNVDTVMITKSAEVPAEYAEYSESECYVLGDSFSFPNIEKEIDNIKSNFPATEKESLKIQVFGDSISDNTWGDKKTWVNLLPSRLSEYELTVRNNAIGGSRLTSEYDNGVVNVIKNGCLEADNDVIVVFAGTNDWASSIAVGDYLNDNTRNVCGAVKSIIEYITANTTARLIFVLPMQRYNETDKKKTINADGEPLDNKSQTLRDVCNAIQKTCAYYSVPCVDSYSTLGINRLNINDYTIDGLHPNDKGDELIADMICSAIEYRAYSNSGGNSGNKGADGTDGKDGADGYTPVRGTDYWTDDDVNAMHDYIDQQIGTVNTVLESRLSGGVIS